MASTYSTNLALELIAVGEQSGLWGATTNTNLGTLIEQSISGYVTQAITDGADTTTTIPNGATGVARNMCIEMTGALTAARNLIVPANKKLYFVYNNTTAGHAVTVKVSGQTGVSVPNGMRAALVSNGTDIVQLVNYLASPTFLTPALGTPASGTLTNCGGTAAGLTAGTASAVAVGGITGLGTGVGTALAVNVGSSGAPVVNGGALGTPSSGTLTNCTGGHATKAGIPQNAQNAGYTCVLADANEHIYMNTSGAFTVPANASVAYPLGTAITFVNISGGSSTIPITSDTAYLAGVGTTGTRTLANYGQCTYFKVGTTTWLVSGVGVS